MVWNIFFSHINWVSNHPNWLVFFRGVAQPPTSDSSFPWQKFPSVGRPGSKPWPVRRKNLTTGPADLGHRAGGTAGCSAQRGEIAMAATLSINKWVHKWYPKWMVYKGQSYSKWMRTGGYPHFRKPPNRDTDGILMRYNFHITHQVLFPNSDSLGL